VDHQLLITAPTADVNPADPIVRVVDAAVYLRPARGGLMVGGFEPDPLPVDPRHQPASFTTEALATWITDGIPPPGLTVLAPSRFGPLPDDALLSRGLWQYGHYYDPATS